MYNMPYALLAIIMVLSACCFGQVAVISGKGPSYPQRVDIIQFVIKTTAKNHGGDSLFIPLPHTWLTECLSNIDTVLHYVDAVKLHRKEIGGCGPKHRFDSYLMFYANKKRVMKISFSCRKYHGGLLDCSKDAYPFAVIFKPGFTRKLQLLSAHTAASGRQ